ncbi:hypothetical protein BDW42DRAFT_169984 [Aspergillus taichungensis]|uniref:Uncharacterized protein n=1 Tax=Aspergillus taichungensis TaxID=482145 RepID=A0A2J5HU88_9EURO|nr:hypothetical protein BDW42DRAFT_169984 [Aspergillus taichungensis]
MFATKSSKRLQRQAGKRIHKKREMCMRVMEQESAGIHKKREMCMRVMEQESAGVCWLHLVVGTLDSLSREKQRITKQEDP